MDTNMEDVGRVPTELAPAPASEPTTVPTLDGWIESLMSCKQLAEADVQRLCEKVCCYHHYYRNHNHDHPHLRHRRHRHGGSVTVATTYVGPCPNIRPPIHTPEIPIYVYTSRDISSVASDFLLIASRMRGQRTMLTARHPIGTGSPARRIQCPASGTIQHPNTGGIVGLY